MMIALELIKNGKSEYKWVRNGYKLSKNFYVSEFKQHNNLNYVKIDVNIINRLQELRDHFNKSITITSGYRSESYNKSVGGSSSSRHMICDAADIQVSGIEPKEVQDHIKKTYSEGGLGCSNLFTHVDCRPKKLTIWYY